MRWWVAGWTVAGLVVLAACTTSPGGSVGGSSENRSTEPPRRAPTSSSAPATSTSPSASASASGCVSGRTEVTVAPGDPLRRQLCVRPGTVVSLVLRPRTDDRRWTAVQSSAPVFVLGSGWRVDADGTAHAALRSAGARGGSAEITALAKAPDVAGAARVMFTLDLRVIPYAQAG